jgi:two-component system CheB/CheR fusion protein
MMPMDPKALLAAIVESSDDAFIGKALDGTILSWNRAAERIFGWTESEIVGRSILALVPPDRQEEETQILSRLGRGERIDHFNTVRLTRDQTPLEVVVSISPIRDTSGTIVGASKILRTLTAQRAVEQAVLNSEARLRGVGDGAVDGIITLGETGLIESINPAGLGTFGFGSEEVLGRHISALMPDLVLAGSDPDAAGGGIGNIVGTGRETSGRRKDQTRFAAELAVSQVQLGDRKIFTAIVRDVTERKQFERALVEAKDLAEAASRAKEHFLSVLSHELRTPLAPVLVELSFIEEQPEFPADLRARLKMIRRNIETEARLVDDLLDLTRISRGKIELHYEVVDLHETVRAAIGMFQPAMDAKSMEVTTALRAKMHHVWADPGRVQQVLLNLVSNAVKFTPANGRIAIRSANDDAGGVEIEVTDSGAGIEPEMLRRLFNAFEQSERTRRLAGGLGLGLSIAKSLADMHGGTLTAGSGGREMGATFRLRLAAVPPVEQPATPHSPDPAVAAAVQRILLVEDHDDTRAVMARLLKTLGCHVTAAASVAEAIAASETQAFDLLISDIGLPDGTGLDVMRHMQSRVPRAIALSGYGQEEDLKRSRDAGFAVHLTKPVNFNMLKAVLRPAGSGRPT